MIFAKKLVGTLFVLALSANLAWGEDVHAMINRANQLADAENYAQAIPLYESAIRQLPKEAVLKNNLMVLYANHGVQLQEQKQYDAAHAQFDKALALFPDDAAKTKPVREAKAGTYFQQAMDLKETEPVDYAAVRTLLEKAMAANREEAAFRKHMANLYLDEGYHLAVEAKYAEAAQTLETGLAHDTDNKTLRQSLANVYLALAQNNPDQRQAWIDKALATDNSPRVREQADRLLKGGDGVALGGFSGKADEAKTALPREAQELSVLELIAACERQLSLQPAEGASLMARLETVEKHVHGEPQKGALAARAEEVYAALLGSYGASAQQSNTELVQAPVLKSPEHYLDEIFKVTDGKVIRWGRFPLRVYVEEPKDTPLYRPEYKEAALQGLNAWKVKTDGFANYVEVKDDTTADVVISFENDYQDRFADPETAPDFYKNYTPPRRNALMKALRLASMFTPGYYGLAPQALSAAMEYQQYKKLEVLQEESRIKLGLKPTEGLDPEAAKLLIRNMAAKEFGHVLGLKASSPQAGDLMYPELRSDVVQMPSARDLQTLSQLYQRPPNIILNVR